MHRSSLVRGPLGLLLGIALLTPAHLGAARAADKGSKVTFDTVDGVTLQGTFYASPKGKDEPTVLLLHKLTTDSHKDGWDSLAGQLNEKGYSVLSFDFRGHGGSTAVDPAKFWKQYAFNQRFIKGGALDAKMKLKESINQKDFLPGYLPYLINDIAAAKMFLDDRNDAGDCNSRALILIGAEDGAALGTLWMTAEWNRHPAQMNAVFPNRIQKVETDIEGKDQYGAVWLTMTTSLGGKVGVGRALKDGLLLIGREKKVPIGFLYGTGDETGKTHAEEFLRTIKDPKDTKTLPFTAAQGIKDTKLAGSGLLREQLPTEGLIVNYLTSVRDKNAPRKWAKVESDRTAYVWTFNPRLPILAKDEKSKLLEPVPLGPLGVQP